MKPKSSTKAFERAAKPQTSKKVVLKLYIAGSTVRSMRAIQNAKEICDENLTDYDYRVHGSGTNSPGRQLVVGMSVTF